jgi:hypothetical protein
MLGPIIGGLQQTTNYRVVLPFYTYAAFSFLVGTGLLFFHTDIVEVHYFNPATLAITHMMALGWGTMIILGASHQLLPVLVEGKLDSDFLGYCTFVFASIGIPMLIYSFYVFNTGWPMVVGATLINVGVLGYCANVILSSFKSQQRNVHAWFIITASLWLVSTTFFGLLLVINFNHPILPSESLHYLSIHAHLGLIGWFLLLVIGVGSRLIPMFLISKYTNEKVLWAIFFCINGGLIYFIISKVIGIRYEFISILLILIGVILFGRHCYKAYQIRIRKNVDHQMKTSLISVVQMIIPIIVLVITLFLLTIKDTNKFTLLYGFSILFGWITAIILGMTFKTLPFIVWNKVYQKRAHGSKTPVPKDLFSEYIYNWMTITYICGFIIFIIGLLLSNDWILKFGSFSLIIAAILYVLNVIKTLIHQPLIQ